MNKTLTQYSSLSQCSVQCKFYVLVFCSDSLNEVCEDNYAGGYCESA